MNITDPIFHDEAKARTFFEQQRWPNGPVCPFCDKQEAVQRLGGAAGAKGTIFCKACRKKFSVSVGTVMESSHIPLNKWLMAFRMMASAKKGVSAHQVHRSLGITYKSSWFLCHRVRAAMGLEPEPDAGPDMGGEGKIVESDETFVGGKKKNVHQGKPEPKKHPVVALVERGGKMRGRHVADVTAKSLRKTLKQHVHQTTELHTDDSLAYYWLGREFAEHRAVNHSKGEYVSKDGKAHVNSAESFFANLKRGIYGIFHSVSEAHLQRYVDEAAFKWNHRSSLGIEDQARTVAAIKGAEGKRLTYRRLGDTANR